ncbi:hypothetical protein AGMMS50276_02690 [Synergistales bacterium]|nr:hypothetical protein AGMMS50276_02690 [Synergistales bacterium]
MKSKKILSFLRLLLFLMVVLLAFSTVANAATAPSGDSLSNKAREAHKAQKIRQAADLFGQAGQAYEKEKNNIKAAQSFYNQGLFQLNLSQNDGALKAFERAAESYQKAKDVSGESNARIQAAQLRRSVQELDKAEEHYKRILKIAPKNSLFMGWAQEGMGRIQLEKSNMDGARKYFELAEKTLEKELAPKLRVRLRRAVIVATQGDIVEGLNLCDSVEKEAATLQKDKDERTRKYGNTIAFQAISDRGEILLRSGQFSEAQKTLKEAVRRADELFGSASAELLAVQNNYALTFMYLGDFDEAKKMIEDLLSNAEVNKNNVLKMELTSELGTLDRIRGRNSEAFEYFQIFRGMADDAGHTKRLAQANIQLASMYTTTGAWGQATAYYQEAFSTALAAGDMDATLISMQGIYAGELRNELGLVGKVDYRSIQGLPWRSALTAQSRKLSDHTAKDEGFDVAWDAVDSLCEDLWVPVSSLDGIRLVREIAYRNAPENRDYLHGVKSTLDIADATLRTTDKWLSMTRDAENAIRELSAHGKEAYEKEYVERAYNTTLNLLRTLAGGGLLSKPKKELVVQTGGIFVEATDTDAKEPDAKDADKKDSITERDIKTLGAMGAILSSKRGEKFEELQKAIIAGDPMPQALKDKMRKTLFSRTAQSKPSQEEIKKTLLRLLETAHPSLVSLKNDLERMVDENGKPKEQKLYNSIKSKIDNQQRELDTVAKGLLDRGAPTYFLLSVDAGSDMLRYLDAWRNVRRYVAIMRELGIAPKTAKSWEDFLKQLSTSIGVAKDSFDKSFGKGASLEKIAKLRAAADKLALMGLIEENENITSLLAAKGNVSYEDRLHLLELSARVSRTLSNTENAEKTAQELLSFIKSPSGSKGVSVENLKVQPEMHWRAYGVLASIAESRQNYSKAIDFYDEALDYMAEIHPLEGTTSQATFDRVAMYSGAIRSSFEYWRENPSEERIEKLWKYLEGMKSRQWRELLATTGGEFLNALSLEDKDELYRLERDRVTLEGAYNQADSNGQREEMNKINDRISDNLKDRAKLVGGQTVDVDIRDIPTADEIRKMLPGDWGLVDYYISPQLSFAILLSKSAGAEVIPLPDVDYDSIFGYSYWMRSKIRGTTEYEASESKFREGGGRPLVTACGLFPNDVANKLFRPVADKCGKLKKLLIIPHDILYVLPFEAMQSAKDDNSLEYLVKKWTFAELPSAFLLTQAKKTKIPKDNSLLLVADPAYATLFTLNNLSGKLERTAKLDPAIRKLLDEHLKGVPSLKEALSDNANFLKNIWSENLEKTKENNRLAADVKKAFAQRSSIKPLDGAQDEAIKLSNLLKNSKKTTPDKLLAGDASESKFFESDPGQYRYIHFACHAYDRNAISDLQPGLVLSPVLDMENDSFLQMGELATVKWNAELITLSACNTGLGDLYVGDGMFGLSTVLLAGGVKGAILTRWTAPDATAPTFMEKIYSYILDGKGMLPADALHAAIVELYVDSNGLYMQPQDWAIFKYVGIPW